MPCFNNLIARLQRLAYSLATVSYLRSHLLLLLLISIIQWQYPVLCRYLLLESVEMEDTEISSGLHEEKEMKFYKKQASRDRANLYKRKSFQTSLARALRFLLTGSV